MKFCRCAGIVKAVQFNYPGCVKEWDNIPKDSYSICAWVDMNGDGLYLPYVAGYELDTGDWIVTDENGDMYGVAKHVFEKLYTEVK